MKGLGIFGLICALLIGVLGLYSCTLLTEFEKVQQEIQEDYLAATDRLRKLEGPPTIESLDPKKFATWLSAREGMAEILKTPFDQKDPPTTFQLRRLRNSVLAQLADDLEKSALSFPEFCAISERWRAIAARPEFKGVQEAWQARVRVAADPRALPMGEPAKKATKEELALIRQHELRLVASLEADKMTRLLEMIRDGRDDPASE